MKFLQDLGMQYLNDTSKNKYKMSLYKCDCGKEFKTITANVKKGFVKSCGCSRKKHSFYKKSFPGASKHILYNTWNTMIHRCFNSNRKDYNYYGGNGIVVCERWLEFENFIEDMYKTYKENLTLDRIDTNKGYSQDNCRWTTKSIQVRNTKKIRKNNTSGYRGVTKVKDSWKAMIGINKNITIGYFKCRLQAAYAYDEYIVKNNLEHTKNF